MPGVLMATHGTAGGGGSGMYADLNTSALFGNINSFPGTVQTSGEVLCTPVNGIGPYTYAWALVSGSSAININNPTASMTGFSAYLLAPVTLVADFNCTVTDFLGTVVASSSVTVQLEGN